MGHDLWVHVEIGPVSRASAEAWLAYGREVLHHLRDSTEPTVSVSAMERFQSLVDEWTAVLPEGDPFHWVTEQSTEEVEFLMKALFEIGLVVEREHDAGRMRLRPPEADEFHVMLVRQILSEMEQEGPAFAHFVEGLRGEWGIAGQE